MIMLNEIQTYYPRVKKTNQAVTGYVPIDVFNAREDEFRNMMKREKVRLFYRGPRVSNYHGVCPPSRTRRQDATHVVFYNKL